MDRAQRPLSPHVFQYRWGITMTLSIVHRATGIVLSLGLLILVCWLIALAGGESVYERVRAAYSSTWLVPGWIAWVFCFFYHLGNGIRHLCWDAGYGFEPSGIRLGAVLVLVFSIVATFGYTALVIL